MGYDHGEPEHAGHLHHVELCTSDLETSTVFWDWLLGKLGYEPKSDWDNGRSWSKGPTYIVLKQAMNSELPFDRQAAGLNHLAFHASSREQVGELTADIRERNDSSILYNERHPYAGGYYALYCEDPEGIKVEVVGPE